MLKLEIHTSDPVLANLAQEYWACDAQGKYLHSAESLVPFGDAKTLPAVLSLVRAAAVAWNPDNSCFGCGGRIALRSRSDPAAKRLSKNVLCPTCTKNVEAAARASEDKQKGELHAALAERAAEASRRVVDYRALPAHLAIVLQALARTYPGKLAVRAFTMQEIGRLIGGASALYLVDSLIEEGVLSVDYARSPSIAFELKGGRLSYGPEMVRYFLIPDLGDDVDAAIAELDRREWRCTRALFDLWLEYATTQCMTYFCELSDDHSLRVEDEETKLIGMKLRKALHEHSVQELWCALWTIVRDAAALASRDYYTRRKAAATMPGKLERLLGDVAAGTRRLKAWTRPRNVATSPLGVIFAERYGCDESSSGEHTRFMRDAPVSAAEPPFAESDYVASGTFDVIVECIHRKTLEPEAFAAFAAEIRRGHSVEDAVTEMLFRVPGLIQEVARMLVEVFPERRRSIERLMVSRGLLSHRETSTPLDYY
jgi:hypothetical protein